MRAVTLDDDDPDDDPEAVAKCHSSMRHDLGVFVSSRGLPSPRPKRLCAASGQSDLKGWSDALSEQSRQSSTR